MKKLLTLVVLFALAAPVVAQEQKQSDAAYLDAYIEMARSDLKTQKTALITQAIPLTEQESAAFWPLYRKYDLELNQLNDERLSLIKDYAASFQTMTDAKAKELTDRMLAWEEKRVKMKKQYFGSFVKAKKQYLGEFRKVLPAAKAARLLQLENRIGMLIDLQIAANVPLVEKAN